MQEVMKASSYPSAKAPPSASEEVQEVTSGIQRVSIMGSPERKKQQQRRSSVRVQLLTMLRGTLSGKIFSSNNNLQAPTELDETSRRSSWFGRRKSNITTSTAEASEQAQDTLVQTMLDQLDEDEMEIAARTSYQYLVATTKKQQNHHASSAAPALGKARQRYHASQCAQRFLRSKRNNSQKALECMRATLRFRRQIDVDALRTAFGSSTGTDTTDAAAMTMDNPNSTTEHLQKYLASGSVYVQGFDRQGRSTYIFVPRKVQHHDAEWTIKEHVYTLERAMACSRAADQSVNAVVDFTGFSVRQAPPKHIGKAFLQTLRCHYAGALHEIFLVDAPAAFHCVWAVFKPFVAESTRRKIHFVKSNKSNSRLAQHYDTRQAAAWMMPGGQKTRELDLHEYLYRTPFDRAFDDNGELRDI